MVVIPEDFQWETGIMRLEIPNPSPVVTDIYQSQHVTCQTSGVVTLLRAPQNAGRPPDPCRS